ncbi:class I SAM-dependent methyltransferase [Candidatus Thiosymbion oneisti]|uniref:class I SAM-dependent methyltransferase n=1 Tax=Candidatus Thiosymbion oneisti TaxID=589554 RepID=UPI001FB08D55|nr:methyltransferase domain-containing protein [Candidatus Thiosymbion oneisti]
MANDMTDCPDHRRPASIAPLDAWYGSTLGRELADQEARCLERMLRDTFGYYLLQVGGGTALSEAIQVSRVRRRILLLPTAAPYSLGLQTVAVPERLPIAADSVDLVVLPHTLEFADDARQVLREAERVLIPEGRLVVFGFNALSLWGLWRLVRRGQGGLPWCGRFLTSFRICDWLSLLGFNIELQETMMFRPPWRRALLQQFSFLDTLGRRFWPVFGGVYALRAVKRVSTLTPLRTSWKSRRPVLAAGAVEPTTRETATRSVGLGKTAEGTRV